MGYMEMAFNILIHCSMPTLIYLWNTIIHPAQVLLFLLSLFNRRRYLQTLNSISAEKNSTIIFPVNDVLITIAIAIITINIITVKIVSSDKSSLRYGALHCIGGAPQQYVNAA